MNNKIILFSAFILMAIAQIFVPAKMISDSESILSEGKTYKFQTAPIDPYDPFRGKYITLFFPNQTITKTNGEWLSGESVYAILGLDSAGFSIVEDVQKEQPDESTDYLKIQIKYAWKDSSYTKLEFDYPFDRFYMEESKAYEAELAYRDARAERKPAYALVSIKQGKAVLKDVMIEGVSIREIAKLRNDAKRIEKAEPVSEEEVMEAEPIEEGQEE